MITNGANCSVDIKSRIVMRKDAVYRKKLLIGKLNKNLRKRVMKSVV